MTRYQPGDTFRVVLDTSQPQPGGTSLPVDADTVTLTITGPDGVPENFDLGSDPAVQHAGTGQYYFDHIVAAAGITLYRWNAVGTDPTPWTVIEPDQIYAAPIGPRLLSLAEAKDALRYRRNQPSDRDNDELNDLIDTITERIEGICGPVLPRLITEQIRAVNCPPPLRQWPVIALVDLDGDDDPEGALAALQLDRPEIGGWRFTPGASVSYPYNGGYLTYRAGRDPVPAGIRDAAREWLKHRWRGGSQRGAATPGSLSTPDDYQARDDQPGATYGIPFEVMDSLRPYARPGML